MGFVQRILINCLENIKLLWLVPLILLVVLTVSNWPGSASCWLPKVCGNTLGQR